MKRGIILIMATIAFLACCVQAVRLDYVGKEELLGQQTFVASEGLRLESIEVPKPEDVVLSECSLANETAVISQLVLSSELSEEDIQKCGQAVVYIEMRYLGCKDAPELVNGDYEVSYYDVEENKIYFSVNEHIDDYKEYIQRVLHLCYHVYQYQQIAMYEELHSSGNQYDDLRVMLDAKYWAREKGSYSGCDEDNSDLWMEKDSKKYALSSLSEYINAINNYWEGTEPKDVFDTITDEEIITL